MAYDFMDWLWGESSTTDRDDDSDATMSEDAQPDADAAPNHQEADTDPEAADAAPAAGSPVEELTARLDELETELADNESTIRSIESSQSEMTETMSELDDTVRRLLGVYDQLTAAENPFTQANGGADAEATDGEGFGIVGEPADPPTPADDPGSDADEDAMAAASDGDADAAADPRHGATADQPADRTGETPTVGFEDLLADDDTAAPAGDGTTASATEDAAPDSPADDAATVDAAMPEGVSAADAARQASATDGPAAVTAVQLADFPAGYAADLLAMEWLADMVETSGPAGALKALSFYEELGWISSDVADTLELYLSGPNLDDDVDPNCPVELTASDHAESYRYVLRLRALEDLNMTAD